MDARAPYRTGTHAASRDAFVFILKSEVLTAASNARMMLDTLVIVIAVK